MAIVLVEQYFDFAWELCDTLTLLNRGSTVLSGTKASLDRDVVRDRLATIG